MKWLIVMCVALLGFGCLPQYHRAFLSDDRIAGVATTYKGPTGPSELAQARRIAVLTDRQDSILHQLPSLQGEARQRAFEDYRLIEASIHNTASHHSVEGTISNCTPRDLDVDVYDVETGQLVINSLRVPRKERVTANLVAGRRYHFVYFHKTGSVYKEYTQRGPVPLTGWMAYISHSI